MAKVIGFDQKIADDQGKLKREAQRVTSLRRAGRNIHFTKAYHLANPVLTERVKV